MLAAFGDVLGPLMTRAGDVWGVGDWNWGWMIGIGGG
jgi:hypothetical protein